MAPRSQPVFLERESYRRRRLADAARLVPVLGFVLLLLPGLLTTTNEALIYIFTVWAVLIVVTAILSRRLAGANMIDGAGEASEGPDGT
ncbi:MAG: hypothetical protein AAF230_09240 [Pseudomonadota bacterium]